MSKLNRLMVLCIAALCSQHPYAQSQVTGIEELFRLADENSTSIQAYRTGIEAADQALKAAKAQRLPDISASASASYLGDGRLWDRDFDNATRIDMPHFGNNFAIEAQQVIYAGGAISSGIRLAELEQQLAELDWQKNRQEIRFLLAGYYLDLYKLNNQLQVLQKNLELTEQMIAHMEARRREGTVLQNDITRYELQRETLKLQLAQVTDAAKILNHRLVTTLHLPEGTEITPDTTLLEHQVQTLAEDDWQALATQSHIATAYEATKARYEQVSRVKHSTSLTKNEQTHRLGQNEAACAWHRPPSSWHGSTCRTPSSRPPATPCRASPIRVRWSPSPTPREPPSPSSRRTTPQATS